MSSTTTATASITKINSRLSQHRHGEQAHALSTLVHAFLTDLARADIS